MFPKSNTFLPDDKYASTALFGDEWINACRKLGARLLALDPQLLAETQTTLSDPIDMTNAFHCAFLIRRAINKHHVFFVQGFYTRKFCDGRKTLSDVNTISITHYFTSIMIESIIRQVELSLNHTNDGLQSAIQAQKIRCMAMSINFDEDEPVISSKHIYADAW